MDNFSNNHCDTNRFDGVGAPEVALQSLPSQYLNTQAHTSTQCNATRPGVATRHFCIIKLSLSFPLFNYIPMNFSLSFSNRLFTQIELFPYSLFVFGIKKSLGVPSLEIGS